MPPTDDPTTDASDEHTCEECGQAFENDRGLQIHIGIEHRQRCMWYECDAFGDVELLEDYVHQELPPVWSAFCPQHALSVAYYAPRTSVYEILAWNYDGEEIPPAESGVEWPDYEAPAADEIERDDLDADASGDP